MSYRPHVGVKPAVIGLEYLGFEGINDELVTGQCKWILFQFKCNFSLK